MAKNKESVENFLKIRALCALIHQNNKNVNNIKELQHHIENSSTTIVKTLEPIILSVFFPILKSISECNTSFKTKDKQHIVDTFKVIFDKTTIDKLPLFFNIYGFLLFEIYDHKNHTVLDVDEEYKLSIVECMTSLVQCLSTEIVEKLYVKENAPKLCQMVYVLLELAKNEQFKTLRISSIKCIMAIAHVLKDDDFNDVITRNQVADIFLFFLPGIASQLKSITLIDEKFGHKIPTVALTAWGRIVTLMMQDYNAFDNRISLNNIERTELQQPNKTQWKDEEEIKKYIEKSERSPRWYQETDKKLQKIIVEFSKLAHHSHPNVRLELVNMSSLLIDNCINTMPTSISHLIDIVIVLSEDDDPSVAKKSKDILENLSEKLNNNEVKSLLDNLEEGFYGVVAGIPRKFNGIDERAQIVALNSLIGYISLFGKYQLTNVLYSAVHLNKLILTLIHISEFDTSSVSLQDEYTTSEYEIHGEIKTPWKKFRLFKETSVLYKIQAVCHLLSKFGASSIISDFLLDLIVSNSEHKKEAIFLLNEMVSGIQSQDQSIQNIISTYIDPSNWYIPLSVMIDENGYEHVYSDIQGNIIQVCLLVEGIGKAALCLSKKFEQFLLKTLYLVLERAGSAHPLIRAAGILALTSITQACGYCNITDLINGNIDYFSFHIERKLNKHNGDSGGLDVLAVVLKYSTKDVLSSTCEVIKELITRTYEKNRSNLNEYLQVFKIFIQCLQRWFDIKLQHEPFKTKKQKQEVYEDFKVSNIEEIDKEDFSDNIMNKSAKEMWKEDMAKNNTELENEIYDNQEYKKPDPPIYIKLTVSILSKSLHSLPSKNQARKLLVLSILKEGIVVLKDWEDELLPITHQIWSPLVDRFKETNEPLIVNYSFQLLTVLACLSKDFIRSRTVKEVLPQIISLLDKLSEESYLKDTGSAYRYSQNYKLQLIILNELPQVITDLDMLQSDVDKCLMVVFKYLSDKQPIPLQVAAVEFFTVLHKYDSESMTTTIKTLIEKNTCNEYSKNIEKIQNLLRTNE